MAIIAQSSLSMFTVFYCLHEKQSGTFFLSKSSETRLFMITYFNLASLTTLMRKRKGTFRMHFSHEDKLSLTCKYRSVIFFNEKRFRYVESFRYPKIKRKWLVPKRFLPIIVNEGGGAIRSENDICIFSSAYNLKKTRRFTLIRGFNKIKFHYQVCLLSS